METILQNIVAAKKRELITKKKEIPVKKFENSFLIPCFSLREVLLQKETTGIIAEFKRKSPSRQIINKHSDVMEVTSGYIKAGASALSVLTDSNYFGGTPEDLRRSRINSCPILRKDFIIDEYQVMEAKHMGADVILLIAAILSPLKLRTLSSLARQTGMEVLLEIHQESELGHINELIDLVGVNNRNLKNFSVSLETSLKLYDHIPQHMVKVSESGIKSPEDIILLQQKGFKGFLIGETFMSAEKPEMACEEFIIDLKIKQHLHENKDLRN